MSAYAMWGGNVLREIDGISLDGKVYSLDVIRIALTAGEPTHRHKKRGTKYVLIGYGKMQCDWWQISGEGMRYPVDMREVAIYRSIDDGSLWVRPREEFEDGRFEALPAAPTAGGGE